MRPWKNPFSFCLQAKDLFPNRRIWPLFCISRYTAAEAVADWCSAATAEKPLCFLPAAALAFVSYLSLAELRVSQSCFSTLCLINTETVTVPSLPLWQLGSAGHKQGWLPLTVVLLLLLTWYFTGREKQNVLLGSLGKCRSPTDNYCLLLLAAMLGFCVFSPKPAVFPVAMPNEEGAEWSHMADEVRGDTQQLLLLHLITLNRWPGSCCHCLPGMDCCCKILPRFCQLALQSQILLMQLTDLCMVSRAGDKQPEGVTL